MAANAVAPVGPVAQPPAVPALNAAVIAPIGVPPLPVAVPAPAPAPLAAAPVAAPALPAAIPVVAPAAIPAVAPAAIPVAALGDLPPPLRAPPAAPVRRSALQPQRALGQRVLAELQDARHIEGGRQPAMESADDRVALTRQELSDMLRVASSRSNTVRYSYSFFFPLSFASVRIITFGCRDNLHTPPH